MFFLTIAWRNLWRNRRRTILTFSAIAFATVLIQLGMSFQAGSYGPMIEGATRFGSGHLQIQHQDYKEHPRLEHTIPQTREVIDLVVTVPSVRAYALRAEAFGLINHGEKSYGAMIVGVDASMEPQVSYLPNHLVEGSYLTTPNSAFVGTSLAKNLGIDLGKEIVFLSHDNLGGVAAAAPIMDGLFSSGNSQLDRSLMQVRLTTFNEVFSLEDNVHRVVIMVDDPLDVEVTKSAIAAILPPMTRVYDWRELMPEINQNIRLDKISNGIIYGTLTIIVVLSIANTFVMAVFERTREFGTLRAIGTKDHALFAIFLTESLMLWLMGVSIGSTASILINLPLSHYGIALSSLGVDDLAGQFFLPDRLVPLIDLNVLLVAPVSIGVGIVVTATFASVRMYRLSLINALRFKE